MEFSRRRSGDGSGGRLGANLLEGLCRLNLNLWPEVSIAGAHAHVWLAKG